MKIGKFSRPFYFIIMALFCVMVFGNSCKKFLNEKPLPSVITPETLDDLQAMLDRKSSMNDMNCQLLELIADNYYIKSDVFNAIVGVGYLHESDNYIWAERAEHEYDWSNPYQNSIYYSNIVINQLDEIKVDGQNLEFNSIKGSALFYRAYAFQQLAQLYCQPYKESTRNDDGIVLKLKFDINEKVERASIQETYDQIISDLKLAADLLPVTVTYPTRPNKAAAYALIARTYLSMREYELARSYASLSLELNKTLIDYNGLTSIKSFNPETIYYSFAFPSAMSQYAIVDSALYESYNDKDLRKTLYFSSNGDNTFRFSGSYAGSEQPNFHFDGLTTSEMYLIRAECHARNNDVQSAMADLNTLMQKRWKNDGSWAPLQATSSTGALNKILTERRKELVFRGLRWSDLRRLNIEGANISLKRIINGNTYTLDPGDDEWVMLIPTKVILHSGIRQNPR